MSLTDLPLAKSEDSHSNQTAAAERIHKDSATTGIQQLYPSPETYDDAIFDDLYDREEQQMMDSTTPQNKAPAAIEAPPLPERNALRASRLLDNLGLKLGGSLETHDLAQTTPHDVYLSSEEDASSSADDFSDYEYDSASEGALSPGSRTSHEDTARAVSVIFAGKPSIIDVASIRRAGSPESNESRRQSCVEPLSKESSLGRRPSTSAGSLSSSNQPARKSSMLSTILSNKQKPAFLKIDPYANGSTYSLERSSETADEDHHYKSPRTPTAILKGVSRTLSLVRKRSRPVLNNFNATASRDNLASPNSPLKPDQVTAAAEAPQEAVTPEPRHTAQSPVTYNDIIRAAKKNADARSAASVAQSTPESPMSPESPNATKKGLLGSLAARRRSLKIVNGRLS